jgi:hypothetical protein
VKNVSAWMEVAANVGVLAGIIFLTIEVSQNTIATKSEASLAIKVAIADSIAEPTTNSELFDTLYKVYRDEEMGPKEYLLASFFFHSVLTKMEAALQQYELGVLDDNVLESFDSELFMMTDGTSFSRRNWNEQQSSFSPEMRQYVAELNAKVRSEIQ